MEVCVYSCKSEMGQKAAEIAAGRIREEIAQNGRCAMILATGASQFDTLAHLVKEPGIDWSKVRVFHLDEYIGLSDTHPASFRKYLKERFVDQVENLGEFVYVNGDADNPKEECKRLGELIAREEIAVACIGIGENGHIAFNDPPADFETEEPYLVVNLDEACRRQQMGEGWFPTLEDVPQQAISMSIKQIMKCNTLVVSVPDRRKADAVKNTLCEKESPDFPSAILRRHPDCTLFLDEPSASQLPEEMKVNK